MSTAVIDGGGVAAHADWHLLYECFRLPVIQSNFQSCDIMRVNRADSTTELDEPMI